jgi:hypothetical protein
MISTPIDRPVDGIEGRPVGHAIKPTGDGPLFANGPGLLSEDEKRRLKSVFGVGLIAEHIVERRLITLCSEAGQQFQVRHLLDALVFSHATNQLMKLNHCNSSLGAAISLLFLGRISVWPDEGIDSTSDLLKRAIIIIIIALLTVMD